MAESLLPPPPPILGDAALLLDFDGTLVDLAERPDAIQVPETLGPALERAAARLEGRIAIVSGRALGDLERHVGALPFALAGSHGFELRLGAGEAVATAPPPGLTAAREAVARFVAGDSRLLVEDKPAGLALHYRAAPEREAEVAALVAALGRRTGLRVQHGKMVAELLPLNAGKGVAVRRIMREPPFAGARPLFVGDDLTDEDGFRAAAALGGGGVLVGAPRETAARWRLPGVAAVLAWIEAGADG